MLYSNYYLNSCVKQNIPINKNFVDWINKVEVYIQSKYKVGLLDIPDEPYMINWEYGMSSDQMILIIEDDLENMY
jgi:hypothetical protein